MRTDDLLIKYLLGEVDPAGQKRVAERLTADARYRQRLEQLKTAWDLSDRIVPQAPAWQEAYARFRQRVEQESTLPQWDQRPGSTSMIFRVSRRSLVAAALIILFSLASVTYLLLKHDKNSPAQFAAVTVSKPGPVLLPDGSTVSLTPDASITYAFGQRSPDRSVQLVGEASFNVVADPSRPFVIRVSDLTIKVLGTSFTVRNAADSTMILVATGSIEIVKGINRLVLTAGETLRASRNSNLLAVNRTRRDSAAANHDISAARHHGSKTAHPTSGATGKPAPSANTAGQRREPREIVRSIIRDIITEKIVPDKDSLKWFALDNGQFIVNDRSMPDSLLRKFRSKYILPDGAGYYYGSVKVTGLGYFFEKSEIYEH